MSTADLADKTQELGHHVPRAVITNLENDRRDSISVAELLVLAAALDVPPTQLVAPVGWEDRLEVLPEFEATPWRVRGWIQGSVALQYPALSVDRWREGQRPIIFYDIHRSLLAEHAAMQTRIKRLLEQPTANDGVDSNESAMYSKQRSRMLNELVNAVAASLNRIRAHRDRMREFNMVLPDLPPELDIQLHDATTYEEESKSGHRISDEADPLIFKGVMESWFAGPDD